MKKGFTIVEVSILFVIFLIVAFLVAPLSLDDTMQARNTSRWRSVQEDFANIFHTINTQKEEKELIFQEAFSSIISNDIKSGTERYKITGMNGSAIDERYRFNQFNLTYSNAVIAYKFFDKPEDKVIGRILYDVNGKTGPNTWGKDVFGLNIYEDRFEPFGKEQSFTTQKQDCSNKGTGIYCSNYYLIGGNFD